MAAQKTKKLSPENEKTLLKIRALLATASGPASDYSIIEWLYKSLNVLDGKANGLLRFDSVIITIITIVLNRVISVGKSPQYEVYSLVTSLILLGASCFFCFNVIRLSWGIVGKTEEEGGKFSFTNEIRFLVSIVAWRTTCFGIAWVASLIALALTSIAFFPVIEAAINTSK